ncbi:MULTISPECIES: hypothetical protein [unclassified Methanoculleus]|jgi:hypothetical protein|uniref:hypothetical protein n=1 Tax=unclassified Methanoculleus TaxID=2619537 RepID=UPI0025F26E29|nr:hypothetical protein [Methanoculleus sp. UBA377]
MRDDASTAAVRDLMAEFAARTGLDPSGIRPRRYLWTDAYAVCNYLGLFRRTGDASYRDLALRLVDQVHHILGRHRDDDRRTGWISGLSEKEGEAHPTRGGLRIGKPLPERGPGEPFDEQLEWDRDGQYYHYLTKWMHALNRVRRVTGDPAYTRWAAELAKTAHAAFTYVPASGGGKRMYWKMSIDLSRPLVPAMGQHDPLDGFVTYSELQMAGGSGCGGSLQSDLSPEIVDMAGICREGGLATDDPLGIGGLLFDAGRVVEMMIRGGFAYIDLLASVLDAARTGLAAFVGSGALEYPAAYRLAFREFGLSIGLSGVDALVKRIRENPDLFGRQSPVQRRAGALVEYVPLAGRIERFWMDAGNRQTGTWTGNREINTVMLATSLAPGEFLAI